MLAKVYLEITNVCNRNCSFCVGTSRKKHFLTVEEFYLLAGKLCGHTEFLYFHLMGEPLLHPQLATFLDIAANFGFKVILTTNGTLLKECEALLLNAPSLFKVSISLHSFEANDTDHQFEEYLTNCFNFADKASKKGIISVFRLWNEGGKDTFNESILAFAKSRFRGEEWAENTKGIRIRQKLFIENGRYFDWPLHGKEESDRVTCFALKDHVGVLCDGRVTACCLDYDGNLTIGNLFDLSLDDILNSEKACCFRELLDCHMAPHKMCRTCGFAQDKFRI